jgi:4-hydroxy-3-polyprenylbenzoate decarboxylase
MGEPVKLVKCQTLDLEVPATAEIVLEGIIPTNYMEEEGPFGESMGYVDPRTLSTVFELTCVTHRKNPIWVSIISQVTPSESSKIKAMGMATLVKRFLVNRGLDSVREVHLMEPLVNLRPYVVVSLKKRNDQEPWDAMQGVLDYGDRVGKLIIAVDEDINPRDPVAVTWAITHRSQPHKDIKVVGDRPFGATPIGMVATHPSSRYDNCESSLLIDATRKADFPPLSLPKKEYMVRAREIWEELGLPKLEPQELARRTGRRSRTGGAKRTRKGLGKTAPDSSASRRRRDAEVDESEMGEIPFRKSGIGHEKNVNPDR